MNDQALLKGLIRVAYENPELREKLLPFVQKEGRGPGPHPLKPPKWVLMLVNGGEVSPKALLVWKQVVEKQRALGSDSFAGAVAYFRNKCSKEGVELPKEYQKGGEGRGKGALASFPIKNEQIEDWVKQQMLSKGLIAEVGRSVAEQQMSLDSVDRHVKDAQIRVAKHQSAIAGGDETGRRAKWLAGAEQDLQKLQDELKTAKTAVESVKTTAERHATSEAPSVSFEKEFQKLLKAAAKEMSKQDIMTKVLQTVAVFNAELDAPVMRVAGLGDVIVKMLDTAWKKVMDAWRKVSGWIKSMRQATGSLSKMLDKAGARMVPGLSSVS